MNTLPFLHGIAGESGNGNMFFLGWRLNFKIKENPPTFLTS
jgi:hypothetical protein